MTHGLAVATLRILIGNIKKLLVLQIILIVTSCCATNAHSYEEFSEDIGGADLLTSPTGELRKISTLPVVASVVTRDEIDRYGYQTLGEILDTVPGVYIGVSPLYHEPVYSIRGFVSIGGVLFLIDGLPLSENIFGDNDIAIGRIPIHSIQRVEVTRGPGSNLFGGEAFTAVVNIETREASDSGHYSKATYGSFDTHQITFGTDYVSDSGNKVSFTAEVFETGSYDSFVPADFQTNLDNFFGSNASLAPGNLELSRKEASTLLTVANQDDKYSIRTFHWRDKSLGIGYAGAIDNDGYVDLDGVEIARNIELSDTENSRTSLKLKYGYINHKLVDIHLLPSGTLGGLFPSGVLLGIDHSQQNAFAQLSHEVNSFSNHSIEIGIGGEYHHADLNDATGNYTVDPNLGLITPLLPGAQFQATEIDRKRRRTFVYFEDEWTLNDELYLTYGMRIDRFSDHEQVDSTRAALVWQADYDLTYKIIYGRGYRVPTFLETDVVGVPGIVRNPDLDPEKLDSIDFAVDYDVNHYLKMKGNIFVHETEDQITQTDSGLLGIFPENIGTQKGRGLELEFLWDISNVTKLRAYYAYQENRIFPSNSDAGYSPHNKYYVSFSHKFRSFLLGVNAFVITDRDRQPLATSANGRADNLGRLDANLRYEITPDFRLNMKVMNLTDERGKEANVVSTYPFDVELPGRSYFLSVEALF